MALIGYYDVFCPKYLPKVRTKRGRDMAAERLRLPIIPAGKGHPLIDEDAGITALRRHERFQEPPGRRRAAYRVT